MENPPPREKKKQSATSEVPYISREGKSLNSSRLKPRASAKCRKAEKQTEKRVKKPNRKNTKRAVIRTKNMGSQMYSYQQHDVLEPFKKL